MGLRLTPRWLYRAVSPDESLNALGLVLTMVGAGIAASGVILTEKHATELASTKWNLNPELRDALLAQSGRAMIGVPITKASQTTRMIFTGPLLPRPILLGFPLHRRA